MLYRNSNQGINARKINTGLNSVGARLTIQLFISMKIHVLHCGSIDLDEAVAYRENTWHLAPYTGLFRSHRHRMTVPVSCYLIEHPRGLILIDTGWHTEVRINPRKYLGWLYSVSSTAHLKQGEAIHEQPATLDYRPKDIAYVFLSHLHPDHVSGLQFVKDAKRIFTSELEVTDVKRHPLLYKLFMWKGVNLETYRFERSEFDVFGDRSLVFVNTPGHTNGLASTIVENDGKFVLLCSDTAYTTRAIDERIIPGMTVDKKRAEASLHWVRNMREKPGCVAVLANHDPDIKPHTIHL